MDLKDVQWCKSTLGRSLIISRSGNPVDLKLVCCDFLSPRGIRFVKYLAIHSPAREYQYLRNIESTAFEEAYSSLYFDMSNEFIFAA